MRGTGRANHTPSRLRLGDTRRSNQIHDGVTQVHLAQPARFRRVWAPVLAVLPRPLHTLRAHRSSPPGRTPVANTVSSNNGHSDRHTRPATLAASTATTDCDSCT